MATTNAIKKPNPVGRPSKPIVDIAKALKLRLKNVSYQDIADLFGVTKPTVYSILQPYLSTTVNLEAWKNHKADIFAAKQAELLFNLTPEKQKEMSGLQLVTAMGILYDKERLETGQATEITGIKGLIATMEVDYQQLLERRDKLLAQSTVSPGVKQNNDVSD